MQESKNFDMLKEALEDEQFVATVCEATSEAEFSALLTEKGIELTSEETAAYFDAVQQGMSDEAELDEGSLDDVSGGLLLGPSFIIGVPVIIGIISKWKWRR